MSAIAAFTELVHAILDVLQGVSDHRQALASELQLDEAQLLLVDRGETLKALFVENATIRAGTERMVSTEQFIDMCRGLALVPARSCVIVISAGSHLLARLSANQRKVER